MLPPLSPPASVLPCQALSAGPGAQRGTALHLTLAVGADGSALLAHLPGRWKGGACLLLEDPQIPVKMWLGAQPREAFPEAARSGLAPPQL